MSNNLLKNSFYYQPTKFTNSSNEHGEKKRFTKMVRVMSPSNNGTNKIFWATTSNGTVPFRVVIKKEIGHTNFQHGNSNSLPLLASTTVNKFLCSSSRYKDVFTENSINLNAQPLLPNVSKQFDQNNVKKLSFSNLTTVQCSTSNIIDTMDFSRTLDELDCRNKMNLLSDVNNDPPLSSTLSNTENHEILEGDYLFSTFNEKCDEYNILSEESSRNGNEHEFHSDQEIRGWDSDLSSNFNTEILTEVEQIPLHTSGLSIENINAVNNSNIQSCNLNILQKCLKPKLETILATIPDLSKSVGSVLAEAGIGAEFHSVGRLKSISTQNSSACNSNIVPIRRLSVPLSLSNENKFGVSEHKNHIIVRDTSDATMYPITNEISSQLVVSNQNVDQNNFVVKPISSQMKRLNFNSAQIPCTFKGCQKSFKTRSAMRKHIQIHGPKQHVCLTCSRSFIERSKLKRHLLVHSGEKPYKCSFVNCGKRFSLDFNLRTHIRSIHSNEKPYSCVVCQKSFSQSANLRVHLQLHKKEQKKYLEHKKEPVIQKKTLSMSQVLYPTSNNTNNETHCNESQTPTTSNYWQNRTDKNLEKANKNFNELCSVNNYKTFFKLSQTEKLDVGNEKNNLIYMQQNDYADQEFLYTNNDENFYNNSGNLFDDFDIYENSLEKEIKNL